MNVAATAIPDVKLIRPRVFRDERGAFLETWNQRDFADAGLALDFVQDNFSVSRRSTLRGLHYQIEQTQGKLVRVVAGSIFDVAVDLRRSSHTFKQWVGVELSADDFEALWIPPGFAHGYLVLSESASISYKCTDFYAPQHERTLRWNDNAVSIEWPLAPGVAPVLSQKDANARDLDDRETFA